MKKDTCEELVKVVDGKVYTTSRIVARKLGLSHKELMLKIDSIVDNMTELRIFNPKEMFVETSYSYPYVYAKNNKIYQEYLINKDGFFLLGMGYTGRKNLYSKVEIMNAFNLMELECSEYLS